MALGRVVGQPVAVSILERALANDTLAHAYLFHGDRGVGKTTTVYAIAESLLSDSGTLPVQVIESETSIKIDQIREMRSYSSYAQKGKLVWLIKDADKMNAPAANAFLKILEEPPSGIHFFLTTTNMHSILPTIISRCQLVSFRAIPEGIIQHYLEEEKKIDSNDDRAKLIARLARGSLGRALEYWEGTVVERRHEILQKISQVPFLSYPEVLGLSQRWDEDRSQVLEDLQRMLEWFRDIVVLKSGATIPLYNSDYKNELERVSKTYAYHVLFKIIHSISEVSLAIQGNARPRFALGNLFLIMKKGAQS